MEERGYRRTWPPRMGDLTVRDEYMIALGEQASAYIEHKAHERERPGSSLSRSNYDVESSRREWAQSFQ